MLNTNFQESLILLPSEGESCFTKHYVWIQVPKNIIKEVFRNNVSSLRKWFSVLWQYNVFYKVVFYHHILKIFLWFHVYSHFACILKGGYICTYVYFYSLPNDSDVNFFNKMYITNSRFRDLFPSRHPEMATFSPPASRATLHFFFPKLYNWRGVGSVPWVAQARFWLWVFSGEKEKKECFL